MDYSQYKILEFRRKFFKLLGAEISITDPATNNLVGYIKMKAWRLRADISVFTDKSMQQSIVQISGRQIVSFKPSYTIHDTATQQVLVILRLRALRTYLMRGHMDILDAQGNVCGYAQETSSRFAIMRRWLGLIPFGEYLELIFAFIPQTFDVMYAPGGATPLLVGRIVHRKNPIIVKMSYNTTDAQTVMDPRIGIAICTLLSILDANKNA